MVRGLGDIGRFWHIRDMSDATTLLIIKAAGVLGWLALLFVLERLRPLALDRLRHPPPPDEGRWGWRRLARNAGLWAVNTVMSPLIVLPITGLAAELSPIERPAWLLDWPGLIIDILLLDIAIYWWHRLNHVFQPLWRFHEIHHLDERLDTTSAVRFHFVEVFLSACARAVPVFLLGIPFGHVVIFELVVLLAALFQHSNIALPPRLERALSRVIITPSIHWIHHHALRADTDSNYGLFLSFWDPLFGTRSKSVRDPGMRIGVEGMRDLPLVKLWLKPFRPYRRRKNPEPAPQAES